MKHIYCILCLLTLITAASAQTKNDKRLNDLATSGYFGKLKLATKITWKNAPDSLLNNSGGFDSLYHIAEQLIAGHFALLSTYYRQQAQKDYIDVKIIKETFDTAGDMQEEADLMAANAENQTYKFGPYHAGKSIINIHNNHTGAASGTGYLQWTGYNKRVQHVAMANGFVINDTLEITSNMPASQAARLKYKEAFIINTKTKLLNKTKEQEVWLHTEVSTTLYKKTPEIVTTDTIMHDIQERDSEGNITREVLTHSNKEQKKETVFHQYEYYK
jgi:hypothetical protein